MKRTILTTLLLIFSLLIIGQENSITPEKISYQAVVRNAENELLSNKEVSIRISILKDAATGEVVYSETQSAITNDNGLLSFQIGDGTTSDNFSEIPWKTSTLFVKTEVDLDGGTNYTIYGVSQLITVPYAFHAKTADNAEKAELATSAETVIDPGIDGTESMFDGWDKDHSDDFDAEFSSLLNIPEGLSDGDDMLTEEQVDEYVSDNNYLQEVPDNYVDGAMIAMGEDQLGDMLYYDGTNYIKLPKGDEKQVLIIKNNVPKWETVNGVTNTAHTSYTYWSNAIPLVYSNIYISPATEPRLLSDYEVLKNNPGHVMIAPKHGKLKRVTIVMNITSEETNQVLGETTISFYTNLADTPVATATANLNTMGEPYVMEFTDANFALGDELVLGFSNPNPSNAYVSLAVAFEWEFYEEAP